MVMRTCERCGQVEVATDEETQHVIEYGGEGGGESYVVCTRCYVEVCDWFYDTQPEHAVGMETSKS